MSTGLKNKIVIILLVAVNIFYFAITFLNFNSLRGTDFNKYGKYLYYLTTDSSGEIGLESGVSYYWFVSLIFNFLKRPLLYSENYFEPIYTASIQLGNFIFYLIGLIGIYFLLKNVLNLKTLEILQVLTILSIFPPLVGARLILKPEIMVFGFLPWVLLFYFEFFKSNNNLYIYLSVPFTAIIFSLKASISVMVFFTILYIFRTKLLQRKFILINILTLTLYSVVFYENYKLNGNFLWEHVIPDNYNSVATVKYIFSFNLEELIKNPYRDNLSTSMISILLADTFGDYWQRYWFHFDGWGQKLYSNSINNNHPGSINSIRISIFLSFIFYLGNLIYLIKEKNKIMFRLGSIWLIGVLTLVVSSMNLISFLSKNFDIEKGDPMKTHLFSFLLAYSFVYFLIKLKIHRSFKKFFIMFFVLNLFFINMIKPFNLDDTSYKQNYESRIISIVPCSLDPVINSLISTNFNRCTNKKIIESSEKYLNNQKDNIPLNKFLVILSMLNIPLYQFFSKKPYGSSNSKI